MRLIKLLVVLVLAAVIALVGYAYLGDMAPNQREIRNAIPVQGGELAPAPATDSTEGDETAADETPATEDQPAPETETEAQTDDAAEPATEPAAEPITEEDTSEAPGD